ncbi:ImmA/IrrE family metallo-endopeptidase [Kordiimonas pumila]|uniref:ImmA/IrrE family metallo-endopeptidase n=1 Tax=Kordiimonas pumila TaxID=2161677 RepID=A0ABV7D5C2_9PROT|nr:ImmA/IrrE family metallo-endopeptidase [Kordiimonas pumila]
MKLNKKRAIESAKQIHAEFGGLSRAPVNVDRIARKLNITIRYEPMDNELSGMIFIKDGKPIIGINSLHNANRKRFTLAHEIGHYRLHSALVSQEVHLDTNFSGGLYRDLKSATGVDPIEVEANAFAAELLMPEHLIKEEVSKCDIDLLTDPFLDDEAEKYITELADKFKVSSLAIQTRIVNLKK